MVVWGIIQWTHRTPGKEKWRLLFHPAMVDFYLGLPGFYFGVAWYVSYLSLKIPQQNSNKLPSHRIPLEKKTSGMTGNDINHTHTHQNYSKMLSWNILQIPCERPKVFGNLPLVHLLNLKSFRCRRSMCCCHPIFRRPIHILWAESELAILQKPEGFIVGVGFSFPPIKTSPIMWSGPL